MERITTLEKIRRIDDKFSWSFFGIVLSVIFFLFGLYTTFIYQKRPKLVFQELNDAPVYSLNEDVSNLQITFQGEDIRKENQTLSLLTLRVANTGNASVLKDSFDSNYLPYICLSGCQIIKTVPIGASSEYLQAEGRLVELPTNRFYLSPVIIAPNEFFDVKFLLLHSENTAPVLAAGGMLAEQSRIEVVSLYSKADEQGFWERAVGGNLLVQVLRILFYAIGTFLGFIAALLASLALKEWIEKRRRKKIIAKLKIGREGAPSDSDEAIYSAFVKHGEHFILRLSSLLSDEGRLTTFLNDSPSRLTVVEPSLVLHDTEFGTRIMMQDAVIREFILNSKLAERKGDKFCAETSAKRNIEQFVFSLSILSPRKLKAARTRQETYGTESKPVTDIDTLVATEAQPPNTTP